MFATTITPLYGLCDLMPPAQMDCRAFYQVDIERNDIECPRFTVMPSRWHEIPPSVLSNICT